MVVVNLHVIFSPLVSRILSAAAGAVTIINVQAEKGRPQQCTPVDLAIQSTTNKDTAPALLNAMRVEHVFCMAEEEAWEFGVHCIVLGVSLHRVGISQHRVGIALHRVGIALHRFGIYSKLCLNASLSKCIIV